MYRERERKGERERNRMRERDPRSSLRLHIYIQRQRTILYSTPMYRQRLPIYCTSLFLSLYIHSSSGRAICYSSFYINNMHIYLYEYIKRESEREREPPSIQHLHICRNSLTILHLSLPLLAYVCMYIYIQNLYVHVQREGERWRGTERESVFHPTYINI